MSALDEYRKYNEYLAAHPTAELEARRYIDLADAALAELEAENERLRRALHWLADPDHVVIGYTQEENVDRAMRETEVQP